MSEAASEKAGFPALSKNERRILTLVFRRRALIQNALAEEMEITQQSASRLVGGLIERDLLRPGAKVLGSGKRGSPSTAFELVPGFACSAGVSIMADAVALAIVDFAGSVLVEQHAFLPSMSTRAVLSWTEAALAETLEGSGRPRATLAGLGVAIAGSFTGDGPGLNTPRYLDAWANVDVAALFAERLRLPAWVENDGNAAVLAELVNGVGRWTGSFAYLYLSAGVGGGIALDGEPWRGRVGNAGEFAGGLPPNIYPFPNLELLRQMVGRDGPLFETVQEMVGAYDPAWPAIDKWIERVRDSVSIIASNATAILDLEAIVLGGLMPTDLAERLIPHVELFDQKRRAQSRPTARLVPAEVRNNTAAIGAAMLPLKATFFR
jgi:predicted NBD/HSP70 family sugar kinase